MNKLDLLGDDDGETAELPSKQRRAQPSVLVSAAKGWNLDVLLRRIEDLLAVGEGPLLVVGAAAN